MASKKSKKVIKDDNIPVLHYDEPIVETQKEEPKTEKEILRDNIYVFVCSVKGRSRLAHEETVKMYNLYNAYHNTRERDYTCTTCATRIFKNLENLVKGYGR